MVVPSGNGFLSVEHNTQDYLILKFTSHLMVLLLMIHGSGSVHQLGPR